MQSQQTSWNSEAYRQGFRTDAHQLLAWGFQDSQAFLGPDVGETEATGLIADAIEKRLNDPMTDERLFWTYDVADDLPLQGEGRTGNSRRRADISIRSKAFRPAARYIFEAKRLRTPGHSITTYLGASGMRRFLDDTGYAQNATGAAMVGYVQSDTLDQWINKLRLAFENDTLGAHDLVKNAIDALVTVSDLPHCYVSVHRMHNSTEVEICHLMLDCR